MASASRLTRSPSASDWSARSVEKAGAWLVPVTVQVKRSVSVSVPSDTVTVTLWVPELVALSVPLITPLVVSQQLVRIEVPLMIGVSLLLLVVALDGRLLVGTTELTLELLRVQPAGGKQMDVESYLRGNDVPILA